MNQPDVRLVVYPRACHCFDDPGFAGGKGVMGTMLKYDPDAAKRSKQELFGFLAKKLGR